MSIAVLKPAEARAIAAVVADVAVTLSRAGVPVPVPVADVAVAVVVGVVPVPVAIPDVTVSIAVSLPEGR